jgi:hypothetical protein
VAAAIRTRAANTRICEYAYLECVVRYDSFVLLKPHMPVKMPSEVRKALHSSLVQHYKKGSFPIQAIGDCRDEVSSWSPIAIMSEPLCLQLSDSGPVLIQQQTSTTPVLLAVRK